MLDATGKIGLEGGFFDGNMAAFGDFDECLRIDVAESIITINVTGKSLAEALIFASTSNPQYDDRLFIELQAQYMKITSSNLLCTEIVSDIQNNFCAQHVLPIFCKKKSF